MWTGADRGIQGPWSVPSLDSDVMDDQVSHAGRPLDQTDLATTGIGIVPITASEAEAAVGAFARFDEGLGHPARLNFGDCFAYACARTHNIPLLFVGDAFLGTDIPSALA